MTLITMPVLIERERLSKRKILYLRPYILWRRSRDIAAEKQILSEIKKEEEEKEWAIEQERREKEEKKRQEIERKQDDLKEIQSQLMATTAQREEIEGKLKVLHEEKHRLFICLKTILAQKDNQKKAKQLKEQLTPSHSQVEKLHNLTFPQTNMPAKYSGENFQRGKPDQGFYQGTPLKRQHSPPQNIQFQYLEPTSSVQTPFSSLQQYYGRGQPGHTEQPYVDLQGSTRPDYDSHRRMPIQRQEYNRPWQQSSHKSPTASERRGHSSRPAFSQQIHNYSPVNYSYAKQAGQQRKGGQKH